MTKRELASELASRSQIKTELAVDCIDSLMDSIIEALASGENIYLRGFGTFKLEKRAAKKARNITTGETVMVPERKVVKFVSCPGLKEAVQ